MSAIAEEVRSAIAGRHPIMYMHTPEENRVVAVLSQLAPELADDAGVSVWTCVEGLEDDDGDTTRDPVAALRRITEDPQPGFFVLKDLSEYIERPDVTRALRNAYHTLRERPATRLVILSPVLTIPELLQKEVCLLEIPLPSPAELADRVTDVQGQYDIGSIPEALWPVVSLSLRGLTVNEAEHVMHRVFAQGSLDEKPILAEIFAEKERLLRKAGFLEYVPNRITVDEVGGMSVLRDWILKRKSLFTQDAVDAGLPIPKGMLIMGISGCGKSMSAKAVASLWHVPLFRLDMNVVFSGMYGKPEAAFHRALRAIESVAPAVLWIDEIENALGMTSDNSSAEQSLTFSTFLTWMQERPPLVFVAATANRIEALPAEIIRKGRFDEVFFCDLPTEDERLEIIRIHMRRNGADPDELGAHRLLYGTRGWSGAEIEQVIVAARIDAHQAGRPMELDDIRRHTARMVPLSQTMAEQIKAIRSWSFNRALRASKEAPKSMIPGSE